MHMSTHNTVCKASILTLMFLHETVICPGMFSDASENIATVGNKSHEKNKTNS